MKTNNLKQSAFIFVLLLGFISLLSDFTHEGARSIYGSYLELIGASAFLIALVSGIGELIGQTLRIVTGYIADKSKKYWTMMFIGYSVNLLVIPLLYFVDGSIYYVAIILILLERVGKGIRAPAKSALTSFTAPHLGVGKSFAIQEALDQFGAFLGPLFVFMVLSFKGDTSLSAYQLSFGLLGIFGVLTIVILVIAKFKYPHPDEFEEVSPKGSLKGNKAFIFYMAGVTFIALGFIDYPLLAFHLESNPTFDPIFIPLLYSLAMGIDAISALIFGSIFDKKGIIALIIAIIISAFIAPLFFLGNTLFNIIGGVILWGIGMGAHESILKAVIAKVVSKENRATAYGIFYTIFGISWFIGSVIVGSLYDFNLLFLVIYGSLMEVMAVILLLIYKYKIEHKLNEEKASLT
jgi:MFS family permease